MALELNEVRRLVAVAGFDWSPVETSISGRMMTDSGDGLFGLAISQDEAAAARRNADWSQRNAAAVEVPRAFDWRSHKGANWLSDVRDQGVCRSCVAFAATGALEARARISEGDPGLSVELSAAHLFFCGSGQRCGANWSFEPALGFLRDTGVGLEADFPYEAKDTPCRRIKPVLRVPAWDSKSKADLRKQAIVKNGPVIGGLKVFEDLSYYGGSGVYKHVGGPYRGQHAVVVIGYDDAEAAWIVRNSWGAGWGDAGYGRIGYGECGIDTEFLFYDPDVEYSREGFE